MLRDRKGSTRKSQRQRKRGEEKMRKRMKEKRKGGKKKIEEGKRKKTISGKILKCGRPEKQRYGGLEDGKKIRSNSVLGNLDGHEVVEVMKREITKGKYK